MENNWKKIEEWSKINEALEKIWAPGYDLMARRADIERDIPWLKGHGANPSGPVHHRVEPPPPKPQIPAEQNIPSDKMLIDGRAPKESSKRKKQSDTQKGIEKLPVMNHSQSPQRSLLDQTQDFQGDPSKNKN